MVRKGPNTPEEDETGRRINEQNTKSAASMSTRATDYGNERYGMEDLESEWLKPEKDPKERHKGYKVMKLEGFSKKMFYKTGEKAVRLAKARKYEAAVETLDMLTGEITDTDLSPDRDVINNKNTRDVVVNDYRKALIAYNTATDVLRIAKQNKDCSSDLISAMEYYGKTIREYLHHPDKFSYSGVQHKPKHSGLAGKLTANAFVGGFVLGAIFLLNSFQSTGLKFSPGNGAFDWNLGIGIVFLILGIIGAFFYFRKD